ncbi:response regulator transcription factor [Polaromonas sp.]|uniref:response regulator transcription factor n=1 Tax=Polaromonas sp. TaxID=1869339 RepID=UPI00180FFB2C|nr:response regulator transcription factor [Polaromonas sp.]NMM05817.1 response regulator transcription factor [Polaromonas sp.]
MTQPPLDRASVLVVEDDDNISHMLKFMLEREQYRVSLALNGRIAKTFIESNPPPSVILLDVMLPFIDGFELVNLIRATAGWQSVPIIMLTAKTQEQDAVRALDAGANDYIHKPFAPKELLARVRRYARSSP